MKKQEQDWSIVVMIGNLGFNGMVIHPDATPRPSAAIAAIAAAAAELKAEDSQEKIAA